MRDVVPELCTGDPAAASREYAVVDIPGVPPWLKLIVLIPIVKLILFIGGTASYLKSLRLRGISGVFRFDHLARSRFFFVIHCAPHEIQAKPASRVKSCTLGAIYPKDCFCSLAGELCENDIDCRPAKLKPPPLPCWPSGSLIECLMDHFQNRRAYPPLFLHKEIVSSEAQE